MKKTFESRKLNIRFGKITKKLFPKFTCCQKCGTTWNFVQPVTVIHTYDGTRQEGYFCLCKKCWLQSTKEERIFYYVASNPYILGHEWTKQQRQTLIDNINKDEFDIL